VDPKLRYAEIAFSDCSLDLDQVGHINHNHNQIDPPFRSERESDSIQQ
jgi:hypothetical protein